ncbi:unnamed protein product [Arabidopsis halleri]
MIRICMLKWIFTHGSTFRVIVCRFVIKIEENPSACSHQPQHHPRLDQ